MWAIFSNSGVHSRNALLPRLRLSSYVPEFCPPCAGVIYLSSGGKQRVRLQRPSSALPGQDQRQERPGDVLHQCSSRISDHTWSKGLSGNKLASQILFLQVDRHSVGDFDPARITRTWSSNLGHMEIYRLDFYCFSCVQTAFC